jgi:chromosome segregation ATPase
VKQVAEPEKMDLLMKEMKEMRGEMRQGFQKVDQRFEQVDRRFEQVDRRFEQVDERFEQVDQRFEQVEGRLGKVEQQIDELSIKFVDFTGLIRSLKTSVDSHSEAVLVGQKGLEWRTDHIDQRLKVLENWKEDTFKI